MNRRGILENYRKVALLIDEMVDNGIVINTDGESIDNNVNQKEKDESTSYFGSLLKSSIFGLKNTISGK